LQFVDIDIKPYACNNGVDKKCHLYNFSHAHH